MEPSPIRWVSGPATVSATVTITGAGPVVLNANQAASGNYAAATATTTFTVAHEVPTLTLPVGTETFGGAAFTVSATLASSGALTYTWVSGPATVRRHHGHGHGRGHGRAECQPGSQRQLCCCFDDHRRFTVEPEMPTLSFAPIGTQNCGHSVYSECDDEFNRSHYLYGGGQDGSGDHLGNVVSPTAAGSVTLAPPGRHGQLYVCDGEHHRYREQFGSGGHQLSSGSTTTPPYGATVNLVPTFSGGTAVIGTGGVGSSNITSSAVSGISYPTTGDHRRDNLHPDGDRYGREHVHDDLHGNPRQRDDLARNSRQSDHRSRRRRPSALRSLAAPRIA